MNIKSKEVAIVVMSCDAYSDLWSDFFKFKKLFWQKCPYNTYLVTNTKKCNSKDATTINCGDDLNWIGRLRYCLNQIDEEIIILMLEDYFISNDVDQTIVDETIDFFQNENASYYKLETRGTRFPKKYKKEYVRLVTPDIRYGISLITSIWDKRFLLKILGDDDYTAWEFEIRRNMDDDISKTTNELCLCDTRNILNISHMVQRGKYLRKGLKRFQKKGHRIDYASRGKIGLFTELYISFSSFVKNNKILRKILTVIMRVFHIKTISMKYEEEIRNKKYK